MVQWKCKSNQCTFYQKLLPNFGNEISPALQNKLQTLAKIICLCFGLSHNCNCKVYFNVQTCQKPGKSGSILGPMETITCCQKLFASGRGSHLLLENAPVRNVCERETSQPTFKTPNFPLTSHIWQICDTKANFGDTCGILRGFLPLWICLNPENDLNELGHHYHHHHHYPPHHLYVLTSLGFAWTLQTMSTSSDLETP